MDLKPLPVFVRVVCPTCDAHGVAEKGNNVLCQNCVNQFLAKNVGMMREVVQQPTPAEPMFNSPPETGNDAALGEFIPKDVRMPPHE